LRGLIEFRHVSKILKRYLLSLLSKLVILTASGTEPPLCLLFFSFDLNVRDRINDAII